MFEYPEGDLFVLYVKLFKNCSRQETITHTILLDWPVQGGFAGQFRAEIVIINHGKTYNQPVEKKKNTYTYITIFLKTVCTHRIEDVLFETSVAPLLAFTNIDIFLVGK